MQDPEIRTNPVLCNKPRKSPIRGSTGERPLKKGDALEGLET
jgi:hypothetical protein